MSISRFFGCGRTFYVPVSALSRRLYSAFPTEELYDWWSMARIWWLTFVVYSAVILNYRFINRSVSNQYQDAVPG